MRLSHDILLVLLISLLSAGASAFQAEEQALLEFAAQLDNFQELAAAHSWHGWGQDDNELCPHNQVSTAQELLCEPEYPLKIDASRNSWAGVVCTPGGSVLCLVFPDLGLAGNVSAIEALSPLKELQMLNLANNSLTGSLPANFGYELYQDYEGHNGDTTSLAVVYLSNNSISGSLPPLWGHKDMGWGLILQRLYLNNNQLTGQLPPIWSADNALRQLARLDLHNNQLTGPIPWGYDTNMPNLDNLVLFPGNQFCGPIPESLQGVVRNYTGRDGPQQVLAEVASLDNACGLDEMSHTSRPRLRHAVGPLVAALASASFAMLLWWFLWRRLNFSVKKGVTLMQTRQDTLSWHSEPAEKMDKLERQFSSDSLDSTESAEPFFDSKLTDKAAVQRYLPITSHVADAQASWLYLQQPTAVGHPHNDGTVYVSCQSSTPKAGGPRNTSWPVASDQLLTIPAPLWQDVRIAPENIRIVQAADGGDWVLGEGSYGMVYKGLKDEVHDVAIKIFKSVSTQRDLELLQTEIAVLRSCNNRNIVHFYGVCFKGLDAWLVMELLEKGNLYNALSHGKGLCTWYHRGANIALDIAKGIHFLHSHHVMHLDLKSPNILLAQDGTAKIADVGLSRMFTARSLPVAKNTGTFHWLAPELISAGRCTEKADIFSFGIVLYEILTAEQPLRGRLKSVRVPKQCPEAIHQLMLQCQDQHPEKRPAAADIIQIILQNHPHKDRLKS